jgi:ABC-type nitrate/sulfonate/bicarbonate transport system permease component
VKSAIGLWWTCWARPLSAFDSLKRKRGPSWGLGVVVGFNLAISATTLLALHLLGVEWAAASLLWLASAVTTVPILALLAR